MDASTIAAIMAAAGVIVSAWIGFLGSKKGTLASAEKEFRETIMEDNEKLRLRVEKMEKTIIKLTKENSRLKVRLNISDDDDPDDDCDQSRT